MTVFIILCVVLASGTTTIGGDLSIKGNLSCGKGELEDILSQGSVSIEESITTDEVEATDLVSPIVYVSHLKSHTGRITMKGNFHTQSVSQVSSFLQTDWQIHSHDTFDHSHDAWKVPRLQCAGQFAIAGGCQQHTIRKVYKLPSHLSVRIKANFHMIDRWTGQAAYLAVDGKEVWRQHATTNQHSINVCGDSYPDARIGIPIDIDLPHSNQDIEIEFGAEIIDNCEAKFAVDNVMVLTKNK